MSPEVGVILPLMKTPVLCFYHANCTDGSASAAVIKRKYPGAECYPLNHGDPITASVEGKILYIVDFSFPPEILSDFKKKAREVHWYDHHKTSLPIYEKLGWGDIDLKESGATLAWKKEFPDQPLPRVLEYVRDKDLFEWQLPDSRAVSAELKDLEGLLDPGSATWKEFLDGLEESEWQKLIDRGKHAVQLQNLAILAGVQYGFEIDFHGHRTLAVNWSLEASYIGEYIYKKMGYPVALLFYFNGKNWTFSLRSNKIDVSQLAIKYGGGGHAGAAGFRQDSIDWLLKLKK